MDTRTVRTAVGACVSAVAPVALWWDLALPAPGRGLPEGSGGAAALVLIAIACAAVFAAYRVRTGLAAPGLVAALLLGSFPSTADLVASPYGVRGLGAVAGSSLVLIIAAWRLPGIGKHWEGRGFVVFAVVVGALSTGLWVGTSRHGATALSPPWALGLTAAILGGEAAIYIVRSLGEGGRAARWAAAALVLVVAGTGAYSVVRSRSWSDPVTFWERALREDPGSLAALGASARARALSGDGAGAAALLRRFVEGVESGAGASLRGEGARRVGAEGAAGAAVAILRETGGDREAARAAAAAAHRLFPGSAGVLLALGEARLDAGDVAEAGDALEQAVRRDPARAESWEALARARLREARIPEALEAAGRASGLAPESRGFSRTLAEALLASGRGPEAAQVLRRGLGPEPRDPEQCRAYATALWKIARQQVSASHRGRARGLLREGLSAAPGHAPSRDLLADLDREFLEERTQSGDIAKRALDGNPDAILVYAVWLCRWGEFEEAWPFFKALLDQRGGTPAVHFQLGLEFWEERGTLQGYEGAVLCYRDALSRDPGYVEARNRLWQALWRLGRTEEAREEARKFFEAAPAHPDAFDAEAFLDAGKGTGGGGR